MIASAFQRSRFRGIGVFFCIVRGILQSLEFPIANHGTTAFRIESAILNFGTTDAVLPFQEIFTAESSILRQSLELAQR